MKCTVTSVSAHLSNTPMTVRLIKNVYHSKKDILAASLMPEDKAKWS